MKLITNLVNVIFIVLMLAVAGLFLLPLLPIEQNIQLKIVESGSMEPTIFTGSVVVIQPADSYNIGDVITFDSVSADVPTTHRIIDARNENGRLLFMTKGDANEEADSQETPLPSVIGKVALAVPYAGFILDFARQPIGFALLIVLPALMIIFSEIEKIWRELRLRRKTQNEIKQPKQAKQPKPLVVTARVEHKTPVRTMRMMDIARPVYPQPPTGVASAGPFTIRTSNRANYVWPAMVILVSLTFSATSFIGTTISYLNDTENSAENTLRAATLDFFIDTDGAYYELDTKTPTDATIISIVTPEKQSAPVVYDVSVEVVSSSSATCLALSVETTLPFIYSGNLLTLQRDGLVFNDPWSLLVSLDPTVTLAETGTCNVNVVYTGRRQLSTEEAGFTDVEKVPLQFLVSVPLPVADVVEPPLIIVDTPAESLVPVGEEKTEDETEVGLTGLIDETEALPDVTKESEQTEPNVVIDSSKNESAVE